MQLLPLEFPLAESAAGLEVLACSTAAAPLEQAESAKTLFHCYQEFGQPAACSHLSKQAVPAKTGAKGETLVKESCYERTARRQTQAIGVPILPHRDALCAENVLNS